MKIRGTVKSLNFTEKTITINYKDVLEYDNKIMIVPLDEKPNENLEEQKFELKGIDLQLLYQLYKERQLLLFTLEKNDNKQNDSQYSVKSLETIDE